MSRWNSTAWNNSVIIWEWLLWFQRQVVRRVVLLLDNFSVHKCAVADLDDEGLLPMVHIIRLPLQTTRYQPMDEGIIHTWKAHYWWSLIHHINIIQHAETHPNEDPCESINFLHVIHWGVGAWETAVKPATLEHCSETSQVKIHRPFRNPSQQLTISRKLRKKLWNVFVLYIQVSSYLNLH